MSLGSASCSVGQQRAHAVDGLDHVGAGLQRDQHDHRRLAVEQAHGVDVLDAVADLGHVGQPHRRAVAPGHHQAAVVGGRLAVVGHAGAGVDLQPLAAHVDVALGPVGGAGLHGGAHVLHEMP
jgi:hypothetical protein